MTPVTESTDLVIDHPDVKVDIEALFARYERALVENDTALLDALFWDDDRTIRYGVNEQLYGVEEIRNFRRTRPSGDIARVLERTQITTFGRDFAIAVTLFRRKPGYVGRLSQTWVRLPGGWRVIAAHVSEIVEAVR